MTTLLIRQFVRRTPMILYRSTVVSSSYKQKHQIEKPVSSSPQNTQQSPETAMDKFNVKPKNFIKLMNHLKTDADNLKRVSYKTFHSVVNSAVKDYISPSESVFLLDCCTMLPDIDTAEKAKLIDTIWNDGILRSGQPMKEQIISLLRAYKVIGRTVDDFNAFLDQFDCAGDVELYETFLYLACENGRSSDGIVKVLLDIKDRGFPLTENLFNALILGHSKNRSIENCEKVLTEMISSDLKPSSETYMQLVRAYIENGDETKANILLNEQRNSFSQEQIFVIIRTAAINDTVDMIKHAMKLLPEDTLLNKGVVPELRNICTELIHMDKVEMGYAIISNLPKIKLNETDNTDSFGNFFLNEMIRRNHEFVKIVDIAKRLIDSDRNKRALHCCCEMMLKSNSSSSLDCIKMLGQNEPLRPHYFWPLFLHHHQVDGENGILNILTEMNNLKVPVDQDTVVRYVLPKLPLTMKDTKHGMRILSDKGIPIAMLLSPVLGLLLQQFKIDEAVKIIKLHKTKVDSDLLVWPLISTARNFNKTSPIASFAELVHTINERNQKDNFDLAGKILVGILSKNKSTVDPSVFESLLKQFHSVGIKIPSSTFDQMLELVQRNLPMDHHKNCTALLRKLVNETIQTNAAEQTGIGKHQRDMTLEELECHLIELQSKNLNTRGVLRRLLQLLVRAGKLDRALQINKLCKEKRVEFSPGMLASILDLMIRKKNLTEAVETFEQLKKLYPAFAVDDFKVVDLASLMIENDRLEDAREILQARAAAKLRGGAYCQKNVWALLTNVAAFSARTGSTINQSREFLDFLIKLGYCTYHNTLLGPIIKEHLLKNEISKAMAEFETVAAEHKKTPMHFELMTKLIELSNRKDDENMSPAEAKEMLSKLTGIVSSIHGSANSNVNLVVAIAKAGTEGQLRKILMDPKLDLNAESLVKQCEYLSASGAETTLFKLAKCSRGVGRIAAAFKEQDLYNLLLNEYIRENNVTAALALFERIVEDEDITIANDFTRKLADLLEKNNLELPSVVQVHLRRS